MERQITEIKISKCISFNLLKWKINCKFWMFYAEIECLILNWILFLCNLKIFLLDVKDLIIYVNQLKSFYSFMIDNYKVYD